MARQFNGTSDYAVSASAINMSSTQLGTYCAWKYWNAFSNDNSIALLHGVNPQVSLNPNWILGTWMGQYVGNLGNSSGEFTRPSAAALLSTGAPDFYWKLCGTASPEPATLGGISMTLVGTTSATHPIATCGGGVASRRLLMGVGV